MQERTRGTFKIYLLRIDSRWLIDGLGAWGNYDGLVAIDVATPVYEGPFDLLLHLILREEVDIHEISLSTIVDAYLAELSKMQELDLEVATEFLLIAATLIELKTRRLLPGREAVDLDDELALWEERDLLLARLLECKTFKDVAKILATFVDDADRVYGRLVGPDDRFADVAPDLLEGLTIEKLERGFISAITPRRRDELNLYHISPIRFTVAEAVEELMEDIARVGSTSFRMLTTGLVERLEIVVRFLAILEMYKQGFIELDQVDRFGDITVVWTGIGTGNENMTEIDSYEG
jgi:segregation and condensation protein A